MAYTVTQLSGASIDSYEAEASAAYAKAISIISVDASAMDALTPSSQMMVDIGYNALKPVIDQIKDQLKQSIEDLLKDMAHMALDELRSIIPAALAETASGIATQVTDAIPVINIVMKPLLMMKQIFDAIDQQIKTQEAFVCNSWMAVGVSPSLAGKYQPFDLFTPAGAANVPALWSNDDLRFYPASSLGKTFVGIFETRKNDDSCTDRSKLGCAIADDHPQYHNEAGYKRMVQWYKKYVNPSEKNVGIPQERRDLMRALRVAMAARSPISNTLFGVYLDLAADCLKNGWITGGFMDWMMSHYVTFPYETSKITGCREYINPWDAKSYGVIADEEFQCKYAAVGHVKDPRSYCGESGWRRYVDGVLSLIQNRQVPQDVENEIEKARKLLREWSSGNKLLSSQGIKPALLKLASAVSKQKKQQLILSASVKAKIPQLFAKARSRRLEGRTSLYWALGILGVGDIVLVAASKKHGT